MMELILADGLLRFDGQVIELFSDQGQNDRYHIRFLQRMEMESGRKDIKLVNLRYGKKGGSGFSGWIVPGEHLAAAEAFIESVHQAKQSLENQ